MSAHTLMEVLSAVASVISLGYAFWQHKEKQTTVRLHVAYGVLLAALCVLAFRSEHRLQHLLAVGPRAAAIDATFQTTLDPMQFSQAALALLEQVQDVEPDTYRRAQNVFQDSACAAALVRQTCESEHAANALHGILFGLSVIHQ